MQMIKGYMNHLSEKHSASFSSVIMKMKSSHKSMNSPLSNRISEIINSSDVNPSIKSSHGSFSSLNSLLVLLHLYNRKGEPRGN